MRPPTEMSLLETLLRRLELRLMLPQTKWQPGHVPEEAGVMVLEVSKAAVDVLLSTIVCPRRPSSLYNRRMPRRSLRTVRTKAVRPALLVQDRLLRVQFQHVKTVVPLSHHSGEGTTPATSFATRAVRGKDGNHVECGD
jgi:hypothetical protein